MSARHTPGPWRVYPHGVNVPGYQVCSRVVADKMNGRSLGEAISDEDAALIAAAPDLLEACQQALAAMEAQSPGAYAPAESVVRAAIAKATRSAA